MKKTEISKPKMINEIRDIKFELSKIETTIETYLDVIDQYNDPIIAKHNKVSAKQIENMEQQLDSLVEIYVKNEIKMEELIKELKK